MLTEATAIPQPLIVDPALPASLAPDPLGSSTTSSAPAGFRSRPAPRAFIRKPSQQGRPFVSVPPRFEAPPFDPDEQRPYRPKALEGHPDYAITTHRAARPGNPFGAAAYSPPILQTMSHSASVTGCTERRKDFTSDIFASFGSALTWARLTGFGSGLTALKSTSTQGSPGIQI